MSVAVPNDAVGTMCATSPTSVEPPPTFPVSLIGLTPLKISVPSGRFIIFSAAGYCTGCCLFNSRENTISSSVQGSCGTLVKLSCNTFAKVLLGKVLWQPPRNSISISVSVIMAAPLATFTNLAYTSSMTERFGPLT
ncbi:hypothetical protein SDC9_137038 [bioreactor metagenome]|uniref:Uncharacterized protein n=1 Tax=bioreactor metagenome TaxID=1076179 RepID=A0A645DMA9_9ZZZZ